MYFNAFTHIYIGMKFVKNILTLLLLFVFLKSGMAFWGVKKNAADPKIKQVTDLISYIRKIQNTDPDSALVYSFKAYRLSNELGIDTLKARACMLIGTCYQYGNNSKLSVDYYLKSIEIYEHQFPIDKDAQIVKRLVTMLNSIAVSYFDMGLYPLSSKYFDKTLAVIQAAAHTPAHLDSYSQAVVLYNQSSILIKMKEYKKAQQIIENAEKINQVLKNERLQAGLLQNQATIFISTGKPKAAIELYWQALEVATRLNDKRLLTTLNNDIGEYYYFTKQFSEAIPWFSKALNMAYENKIFISQAIACKVMSQCYDSLGQIKQAHRMRTLYSNLSDSLSENNKLAEIPRLAMQYEYDRQMRIDMLASEKEVAGQRTKKVLYLLLAILFCSLSIIITLLYTNQKNRLKAEKLKLLQTEFEKQNLELDQKKLENQLLLKNKELATHAMQMGQKTEKINEIADRITELNKGLEETGHGFKVKQIVKDLHLMNNDKVWEEFEKRFKDVHHDFHTKLITQYPKLTSNEKKLCAFLRLNMSTKEISAITSQTPQSIKIARSRLRKKLGISQDVNLVAFLENL